MNKVTTLQIGKGAITPGSIAALSLRLKTHKFIRITVLKASGRTREKMKEIADSLIHQLPERCSYTIIGFTIILRKHVAK